MAAEALASCCCSADRCADGLDEQTLLLLVERLCLFGRESAVVGRGLESLLVVLVVLLLLLLVGDGLGRGASDVGALEVSCDAQHGLQASQPEVVVRLRRQLRLAQLEQQAHLGRQGLGGEKTLAEQQNLADENLVCLRHGHAAEQLLQIVGKL